MAKTAEWFLYPRVCPILSLSQEDLVRSIEIYGRSETFTVLANLISKNYDFPYARYGNSRAVAPASLGLPRIDAKPRPAPPTLLLGGYRCTRLPGDVKIPGITLIMQDNLSKIDWVLDCYMEVHRMKCWVAIQGKAKRWAEADLRSPCAKASHVESLVKILDAELTTKDDLFNHGLLRNILIAQGEAIPPTTELYLQTIEKLNPSSISAPVLSYGIAVAAMACLPIPSKFRLAGLTDQVADSLRDFVKKIGRETMREMKSDEGINADLVFIDAIPYGTHDMRAYFGEESTPRTKNHSLHIDGILSPLRQLIAEMKPKDPPTRVALVASLREMPLIPTVEPLLLNILADTDLATRVELFGALISQRRDYAVYLMVVHATPRENATRERWAKLLNEHYPREEAPRIAPITSKTWDALCLSKVQDKLVNSQPDTSGIAVQGPRLLRGSKVFPTRTRTCVIISETTDLENGSIAYVFGDVIEPPEIAVETKQVDQPEISDPLLSRMVTSIRDKISQSGPLDTSGQQPQ